MKLPSFKINFVALYRAVKRFIRPRKIRKLGLIRDKWDERDLYYKVRAPHLVGALPVSTNRKNISEFPHRYDQGDLGSCVGNGLCYAFRRVLQVNLQPDFNPSRLFAYYNARTDKQADEGASIRDGFKAVNKYGICSESKWPYITRMFSAQPDQAAYADGEKHQSIRYERIYPVTVDAIKDVIARGFPVVYGKTLFDSFMGQRAAQTGIITMPRRCEKEVGGHCMTIFDYDTQGTVELNSWGDSWGINGTCHVPWEYVLKYGFDFWTFYSTE